MKNSSTHKADFQHHKRRQAYCAEWLKSWEKALKRPLRLSVLMGILQTVLIIIQAWFLASVLHALVIEHKNIAALSVELSVLLAVFGLRSLCIYVFQVHSFKLAASVRLRLQKQLLDKLDNTLKATMRQSSGEMVNIIQNHAQALDDYFQRYLPQKRLVMWAPLLIVSSVFYVNWLVGVILLVTGPLVPLFMILIGMGAESASRRQFVQMSRMSGYFLDRIQGLETLKLFGQAQAELARIGEISTQFTEKTMAVLSIAFLSSAVLEFFSAVAVALVAVYVGLGLLGLVHFGPAADITLQQALFVLLLAPEYFLPLRQLSAFYHDRAQALAAADHLLKLLDAPEFPANSVLLQNRVQTSVLACDRLCKHYGESIVLDHVYLSIKPGEKVVLTGESGAGKTTLLKLLVGLDQPDDGEIYLQGQLSSRSERLAKIAWVGQKNALFSGSIADNISLFDSDIPLEQIEQAAYAAGVMNFAQDLPDKLNSLLGENGFGLSGGQIQRIALARAFVKNSGIIILDEPTAHLDPVTKQTLLDVIERLFAAKTVLIASHDSTVIQRFDRHISLHNGRIA
ncbi:thiol reductant ABC exporter subunit CydD [methane-oxidizing endosymbiont of Gigantopelta aegis]|uniref:thiol reductant ABC exporter subunit CydD n=1 Tax=methane-oxidizing endosymbiont of Gigantopelta aegis TaxID=2794938 RepID=UPI0018DCC4BA|nr:thiol reductant ABC exporter subunit CydD [methane-oxidizing endosymbiont of Gigantopelta aegis]